MGRSGAIHCSGRVAAATLIQSKLSSFFAGEIRRRLGRVGMLWTSASTRSSYATPAVRSSPPDAVAASWQAALVQPRRSKMPAWISAKVLSNCCSQVPPCLPFPPP